MIVKLDSIKKDKKKLREFVTDNECEKCGYFGFIQLVSAVIVELKTK